MTKKAKRSQLLDSGLSTKVYKLGNPFIIKTEVLWRDIEICWKFFDAKLPRKVSRVNYIGARTENRHRWARRVS